MSDKVPAPSEGNPLFHQSEDDLKRLLIAAIRKFYRRDRALIKHNVYEVTITHRLAVYIENELRDPGDSMCHVDLEYDKDMEQAKELVPGEDGKRPDIIMHTRRSNAHNQLIVELKKNTAVRDNDDDDRKLRGATDPNHHFRFTLGAHLNFKRRACICTWYSDGEQREKEVISPMNKDGVQHG